MSVTSQLKGLRRPEVMQVERIREHVIHTQHEPVGHPGQTPEWVAELRYMLSPLICGFGPGTVQRAIRLRTDEHAGLVVMIARPRHIESAPERKAVAIHRA